MLDFIFYVNIIIFFYCHESFVDLSFLNGYKQFGGEEGYLVLRVFYLKEDNVAMQLFQT